MNWVQLHLALNHIPVLGTVFIAILLIHGLCVQSQEVIRLSLIWFVVLAGLSIPIKFTGDFAHEQVRAATWMDAGRAKAHEEAADQATTGIFLLGVAAAVGLFVSRGQRKLPVWSLGLVLVLATTTALLMARAAHLGGRLRHDELRQQSPQSRSQKSSQFGESPGGGARDAVGRPLVLDLANRMR